MEGHSIAHQFLTYLSKFSSSSFRRAKSYDVFNISVSFLAFFDVVLLIMPKVLLLTLTCASWFRVFEFEVFDEQWRIVSKKKDFFCSLHRLYHLMSFIIFCRRQISWIGRIAIPQVFSREPLIPVSC